MSFKKYLLALAMAFLAVFLVFSNCDAQRKRSAHFSHRYYVSNQGDDKNPGTLIAPFKTIQKVNSLRLKSGNAVYFKGGETFNGSLVVASDVLDLHKVGNPDSSIWISSYGDGQATINGDSSRAISLYRTENVYLTDLKLTGLGGRTEITKMDWRS